MALTTQRVGYYVSLSGVIMQSHIIILDESQPSRGLHPVGALSMPPLVWINTQHGLPSMSQKKREKESRFSDPSRLPAVDRGLGDYTQWVHLACPHWIGSTLDSATLEWSGRHIAL